MSCKRIESFRIRMCYEGPDLFFFFFTIQVKCQSVFVPSVQNFLFALQQIVA